MTASLGKIRPVNVFKGSKTTAASATSTSTAISLARMRATGSFSLNITATGTGTVTLKYTMAPTRVSTFVAPDSGGDIKVGVQTGTNIFPFTAPVNGYMKILQTETGGANELVSTLILSVQ